MAIRKSAERYIGLSEKNSGITYVERQNEEYMVDENEIRSKEWKEE